MPYALKLKGRCPNQPDGENTHPPLAVGPFARKYCEPCSDGLVVFLQRIGAITTRLRASKRKRAAR
jgi:hypothetical protein